MEKGEGCIKMVGMYGDVDLTNLFSVVVLLF